MSTPVFVVAIVFAPIWLYITLLRLLGWIASRR